MKWSFWMKIEVEASDLASFLRHLKSSGIEQKAKETGVLIQTEVAVHMGY